MVLQLPCDYRVDSLCKLLVVVVVSGGAWVYFVGLELALRVESSGMQRENYMVDIGNMQVL